jgi:hypothetical protein
VRYRIERDPDFDDGRLEKRKTWVESFYTDEEPTEHERMLVLFSEEIRPRRAWWLIAQSSNRFPGEWTEESDLMIDDSGCVEWDIAAKLRPQWHYAICWA